VGDVERSELEAAITGLESLLATPDADEAAFQSLFERSPVIFEVLGYDEWLPRPRLDLSDGRWLEPDFLARLPNGVWHVIDLKLPTERVLLDRARRNTFTAMMASYIAQVEEYRDYFADLANRDGIREKFRIEVHPNPDLLIFAGRDATIDAVEVHQHSRRRAARLEVQTYDQLLAALERAHAAAFGHLENLNGLTFFSHLRFRPGASERSQSITEVWGDQGAACLICLNATDQLTLVVTEPGGRELRAAGSVERDELHDEWVVLSCEVGSGPSGALLQVRLEDRVLVTQVLPERMAAVVSMDHGTVGSARNGTDPAVIDLAEHLAYSRVLTFRERHQLIHYLWDRRTAGMSKWAEFDGRAWMTFDSVSGDRSLKQPDERYQPTVRESQRSGGGAAT
jgi:hypothetical protein